MKKTMKKITILSIALMLGFSLNGFGQNTVVFQSDVKPDVKSNTVEDKDKCPYRISGICSTEDIGGVDTKFETTEIKGMTWVNSIVFTNHNEFPVTIVYEISSSSCRFIHEKEGITTQTGCMTLKKGGRRTIKPDGTFHVSAKMVVRKLVN